MEKDKPSPTNRRNSKNGQIETLDSEAAENAQFICEICNNALIDTVGGACGHTFCTYCLFMWRKNYANCPTCTCELGQIVPRPDIDNFINDFFSNANPRAKSERDLMVQDRRSSCGNVEELQKILFQRPRIYPFGVKAGGGDESLLQPKPRKTTPQFRPESFDRLNRETNKLEKALTGTYARIIELGQNICAEEDALAPQYFGKDQNQALPLATAVAKCQYRPTTASPGLGLCIGAGMGNILPRLQGKEELDELLEQTDEMIRIEQFLKKYSFEHLKGIEVSDLEEASESEYGSSTDVCKYAYADTCSEKSLNFSPRKTNTPTTPPSIHPAVQDYMKKNKIKTRVQPRIPSPENENESAMSRLATPNPRAMEEIHERMLSRPFIVPQVTLPPNELAAVSESSADLLRCRDKLLKLRERYTESESESSSSRTSLSRREFNENEDQFDSEHTNYPSAMSDASYQKNSKIESNCSKNNYYNSPKAASATTFMQKSTAAAKSNARPSTASVPGKPPPLKILPRRRYENLAENYCEPADLENVAKANPLRYKSGKGDFNGNSKGSSGYAKYNPR